MGRSTGRQLGEALRKALRAVGRAVGKGSAPTARQPAAVRSRRESGPAADRPPARPRSEPAATGGAPPAAAAAAERKPAVRARPTGHPTLHPLLRDPEGETFRRLRPGHGGVAPQLTRHPTDAADLTLGLDFGTATVKAVIRDRTARQAFAVPFGDGYGNRYLLPSRVFVDGGTLSLDSGGAAVADLKLGLLRGGTAPDDRHLATVCGFLALVIRHARGWFLDEYAANYRSHALEWQLGLGLASRSYEDAGTVSLFRRLGLAAANLAADGSRPAITQEAAVAHLRAAGEAVRAGRDTARPAGAEFAPADVDAVPEIVAQVHGFVESSHWDPLHRPYMCLVDVGGGTVDAAFFGVLPVKQRDLRFVFYATDVEPYGTVNLHRARIAWILGALDAGGVDDAALRAGLARAGAQAGFLARFPEAVEDYVAGLEFEVPPPGRTVDEELLTRGVLPEVNGCLAQGRRHGLLREGLDGMPLFVCGGGSHMRLYAGIAGDVNARWRGSGLRVAQTPLPLPDDLVAPGLGEAEFDRLSVAYGLSLGRLGEILRPADIPPLEQRPGYDVTERYVGKDQI